MCGAAIGGRIKYLVDTPEMIWGCLDTHSYLDAARRFMRAAEVHHQLQKHASAELKAMFPLIKRQWPNIQKFRSAAWGPIGAAGVNALETKC